MKLINLTGHNINLDGMVIPSDGILRLEIESVDVKIDGLNFPIVKREVKEIVGDVEKIKDADAVIVSAQMVSVIKEKFPTVKVLTVGETIREKQPDGSVIIRGAKNLVIN